MSNLPSTASAPHRVTATLSLASVLAESARRCPDKVAVIESGASFTYAQVWERSRQVAAQLIADGVAPGDRVALLAPNVHQFVTSYFGILAAGGVVVPVPALLQGHEAAYLLENASVHHLLFHPVLTSAAEEAGKLTGAQTHDITTYGQEAAALPAMVTREPWDAAVIFFTSGTTGRPKGATLTHFNLVMNATVAAFDGQSIEVEDVMMACLPLFHIYGQSCVMNAAFRRGATIVLQPRFDPAAALELMQEHHVTALSAVPTMYVQLLKTVRENPALPVPALRDAISGGAALPVAILEQFEQLFGTKVHEGYGLSETSPVVSLNQDSFGVEPGSVGHPIWGVEVAIADPAVPDAIVPMTAGERGEVVVRGHLVLDGYWENEAATDAAIVDGWFRTGDIGILDETGRLRIVDRTKDLVIRGGFNVYPREVEETLMRYPGVAQVAVIGVPDDNYGEEIVAVIVPTPEADINPDDVIAWSREQLGKHKYPRRVDLTDELPLGPSMKVLKRELRARYTPRATNTSNE